MSLDTYFCFCCLSTDSLTNMFGNEDYAQYLEDMLNIQPNREDYEDDSYVCRECAVMLQTAATFKKQVFSTLDILEKNGLIKIDQVNEKTLIMKTNEMDIYEEKEMDSKLDSTQEFKQSTVLTVPIKEEISATTPSQRKREREKETGRHSPSRLPVPSDGGLKCRVCSEVLPNKPVYHLHMNQHYPVHVCDVCGKGFQTKRSLHRHRGSHDAGPFKCTHCDIVFNNYNTYSSHRQRKHSTKALYACPSCPERFETFTRRAHHLRDVHHTKTGDYVCKVCGKRFLIAGLLNAHSRKVHMKIKLHACMQCGASFTSKPGLVSHQSMHTGIKEFQCHLCHKSYTRKNALEVHMRIHNGIKPFSCQVCGKSFTQKCGRDKHLSVHKRRKVVPDSIVKSVKKITVVENVLIDSSAMDQYVL